MPEQKNRPGLVPDMPVDGLEDDALRRAKIVKALVRLILRTKKNITIGVLGDWGTGKTTFMRMIEAGLKNPDKGPEKPEVLTVWFNAWEYYRQGDLVPALLLSLSQAVEEAGNTENYKDIREKLKQHIPKFKSFLGALNLNVAGISLNLEDLLSVFQNTDDQNSDIAQLMNPVNTHQKLRDALRELAKAFEKVVVFVDDLDRCVPEAAINILESLKTVFNLDGFVFVLGLDHRALQRAVAQKFYSGDTHQASLYLEKIIQVPFRMPELEEDLMEDFISKILPSADKRIKAVLTRASERNPRRLKRLINTYLLTIEIDQAKSSPQTMLALVMWNNWEDIFKRLMTEEGAFEELKALLAKELSDEEAKGVEELYPGDFLGFLRQDEIYQVFKGLKARHLSIVGGSTSVLPKDLTGELDQKERLAERIRAGEFAGKSLQWADLSFMNLRGADLSGSNLTRADLRGADLRKADLRESVLNRANLSGADLREAELIMSELINANLVISNLRYANFYRADLAHADLREADLSEADLSGADLSGADLRKANLIGLESDNISHIEDMGVPREVIFDESTRFESCVICHDQLQRLEKHHPELYEKITNSNPQTRQC